MVPETFGENSGVGKGTVRTRRQLPRFPGKCRSQNSMKVVVKLLGSSTTIFLLVKAYHHLRETVFLFKWR